MTSTQIHRHTRLSIFMHWFNAGCWIFLLLTGLGLIRNDDLQPFTSWPIMLRQVFGGGANLLLAHEIVGITWAGGFLLYGIIRLKSDVLPFIREIFTVDIQRDFLWLITKGIQMTLGYQDAWRYRRKIRFQPQNSGSGFLQRRSENICHSGGIWRNGHCGIRHHHDSFPDSAWRVTSWFNGRS